MLPCNRLQVTRSNRAHTQPTRRPIESPPPNLSLVWRQYKVDLFRDANRTYEYLSGLNSGWVGPGVRYYIHRTYFVVTVLIIGELIPTLSWRGAKALRGWLRYYLCGLGKGEVLDCKEVVSGASSVDNYPVCPGCRL